MPRVRHRSPDELPPSPVEFAYPVDIPESIVLGAAIMREVPHPFSLHVFQALRMTFAWAAGAEVSGIEFDSTDFTGWEEDVLHTEGIDEALWAPIAVIVGELARPSEGTVERLSRACLVMMEWALSNNAPGTAALFSEAAAVVWATNARLAWICGKIYREQNDFVRAETWLKRAKRVAVWTGDADLQALAITSLGNLKVHRGDLAGGRELLMSAVRFAKRLRLRERQAKALHDLLIVSIYEGRFDEAERHASEAYAAYGPDHTSLIDLAYDVTLLWTNQGLFGRALPVLDVLATRFKNPDRQLRVLASTARAAGAVGDRDLFHDAWAGAWALLDGGSVDHLRAAAPLDMGLGALSLGLWEHAEVALTASRDAATDLGESDTLARVESSLEHLQRRQAADQHARRPASRPRHGDLSTALVRSITAQAIDASGASD